MAQVIVRENESLESALKRFKRSCARDGVMSELRKREHYEKPSVKRKKKSEAARKKAKKYQSFAVGIRGVLKVTLKEQLMADFKEAMKAKDEVKKNTISFARAAIKQYEVDNREELDDEGIVAILSKQVKMRKDALADFEKAGRTDLANDYKAEIEILKRYLPEQMDEAKIKEVVQATASELGIESGKKNMGKLMGAVMKKVKGLADGNDVRKAIEEFLSE